jgi:hypothetical protein
MTATASVDRRARAARVLVPLFFVSGATSLVYETLWARQLHWVFGTSQLAITTVSRDSWPGSPAAGSSARGSRIARDARSAALRRARSVHRALRARLSGAARRRRPVYKIFWHQVGLFSSPLPS